MDLAQHKDRISTHLALSLPEILREIMSFIPTNHLVNEVTFVSSRWEAAAREQIVSRKRVILTPENMAAYLDVSNVQTKRYKRVTLTGFNFENLNFQEISVLQNFSINVSAAITELKLDYFPQFFVQYETKSLETTSSTNALTFPKVVKLEIDLMFSNRGELVSIPDQRIFLRSVALFPNLKILQCGTLPKKMVDYFLSKNRMSIYAISLRLDKLTTLKILRPSISLTCIELNVDIFNNSTDHDRISEIQLPETLPKLKSFKICISPNYMNYFATPEVIVPVLNLKFTRTDYPYSTQFPTLEKLVISKLWKDEIFLVDLRVPLPPEIMGTLYLLKKCPCSTNSRENLVPEVLDCSDKRIVTTFTNLNPRWEIFDGLDPYENISVDDSRNARWARSPKGCKHSAPFPSSRLRLEEVDVVVGNCDVLSKTGTPTNFPERPPHFCVELEILDNLKPPSVFSKNPQARTCPMYDGQREVERAANPRSERNSSSP
ncbi:hypothetical protein Fcan01_25386 [Folsomia candida]|uniref:F-box domain-containing protein n=1 Tax=Folsomia candida TaxID=158441 RepID=A0A226D306_FOLCA|nr:hypothetical protein Fcan01_25386 [Folsomia candida]